jgi:succinylglutamate desuccinylase
VKVKRDAHDAGDDRGRVIGSHAGDPDGPLWIVIAGLHGNEPEGIRALERVLDTLARERPPFRGRLVGVRGNLSALAAGIRAVDRDLNRGWAAARLSALRAAPAVAAAEDREMLALDRLLSRLTEGVHGPIRFLDLHATSGDAPPFLVMADTAENRRLVSDVPVPVICGLENVFDGTLVDYLRSRGHVGVSLEGGRIGDPRTIACHEAALWILLAAQGLVRAEDVPDLESHRTTLSRAAADLPRRVHIRHRHAVAPGDGFRMCEGWRSFQPVAEGDLLGHDRRGAVTAPASGVLLFPLYQENGTDGFFIGEPE